MTLEQRINALVELGRYMSGNQTEWQAAKERANRQNAWFVLPFIELAVHNIVSRLLTKEALLAWTKQYQIPEVNASPKRIGIVMAGNIPLVGFADWLGSFICGHISVVKFSSKDDVLLPHLWNVLSGIHPETALLNVKEEMLKGCDAYIATGSTNTSRYFDYYFGKYPNIIRKNRTSIAVLSGHETAEELSLLANDCCQYFGQGCRNVTQVWVPEGYDFIPLLNAFAPFEWQKDHDKYRNNYDYNLAIHILNNQFYMTNGSVLLVENASPFSPISQIHYQYYQHKLPDSVILDEENIQCKVGHEYTPFGQAQQPTLNDFADGVNTIEFLLNL